MRDPLSLNSWPSWSPALRTTTTNTLGLATLPLHIHEVAGAWAFYHTLNTAFAPAISKLVVPDTYARLDKRTRIIWNVKFTSFVQSTFITALTLYVIWQDGARGEMDWAERIWGYTGAGGLVQACAAGYFLWDMQISVKHLKVLGKGSLAHAVSALMVSLIGFRPFANYYGLNFILYEVSTPFLQIHWVLDKLGMTGSRAQLYNGVALLSAFFGFRVVWGNYQSVRIYSDLWKAMKAPSLELVKTAGNASSSALSRASVAGITSLPKWLVVAYLASNTVLNVLNMYWFGKMLQSLRKRFEPADGDEPQGADAADVQKKER